LSSFQYEKKDYWKVPLLAEQMAFIDQKLQEQVLI
jgi:hypothetical protein